MNVLCLRWIVLIILILGVGCIRPHPDCGRVKYYPNYTSCGTAPCPRVKTPGFAVTDFSCTDLERPLSAIRAKGVGVIVLGDRLRIIIPVDRFFDPENFSITPCALTAIADIADVLKRLPCVPMCITGHTDDVGTIADRIKRSKILAQEVAAHLWAQGIDWDRMCIEGKANCDQIASDKSVFGSSDNRRIEIRIDFSGNYRYNCQYNNAYCPDCLKH